MINEKLVKKLATATSRNMRMPEIKIAQIRDLRAILKTITGYEYWDDCMNYIIQHNLKEGIYLEEINKIEYSEWGGRIKPCELIKSFISDKICNYKDKIVKISDGFYKPLNSCLSEIECEIGRILNLNEIYSLNDIIDSYVNKGRGEYRKINQVKEEVREQIVEQNIRIEIAKDSYKKRIIAENTIDKIKDAILEKEVNKKSKPVDILGQLILPKAEGMEEKEALDRSIKELLSAYQYPYLENRESKINALEERCQEKYDMSLKEYIRRCIETQTTNLDEIRKTLGVSEGLWKAILSLYEIDKTKVIKTIEGEPVDSEAELKIDNIFHEYEIPHKKNFVIKNNKGKQKKRYIADWLIDERVIVEYFGWLDTNHIQYKIKTNEKIRFYSSLICRGIYFVPLYHEDLLNINSLLVKLNQFSGINFPQLPEVPQVSDFEGLLE